MEDMQPGIVFFSQFYSHSGRTVTGIFIADHRMKVYGNIFAEAVSGSFDIVRIMDSSSQ